MATEYRRMQQRRGTSAEWSANNIVPLAGEITLQTGPGTGEARAKIGDGMTPFGTLPWVFEVDQTARDGVAALDGSVASLDTRVSALEDQASAGGSLSELQAQVAQNTTDIQARQMLLPVGASPGDVLFWDGTTFSVTALSPAPQQATMLFWDALTQAYRGTEPGAVGQALIIQPGGVPGWGNPSTITYTLTNRSIPLMGSATVVDAFNAAAPTIDGDEVVTVTWETFAYHYIGAPGIAITTATAADFTLLGNTNPSIDDAPADGQTYGRRDGDWVVLTATYDLYFDFGPGAVLANAERALVLARAITIPADLTGSQVSLTTGDASAPVLTLYEGAIARATLTLTATGGTWAAVVPATPIALPVGALVRLTAPATVAAAFTGLRASVAATRT